ncbi:MAG: hypothetical protein ACJ76U_09160 [Gaiellaceae bacterium]
MSEFAPAALAVDVPRAWANAPVPPVTAMISAFPSARTRPAPAPESTRPVP